jgi:hypothetical protein
MFWKKLFEETGALKIRHANPKKGKIDQEEYRRKIEENPHMLQRELKVKLARILLFCISW